MKNNSVAAVLAIVLTYGLGAFAWGSTIVENFDYGSSVIAPISSGIAGDGWAGAWSGGGAQNAAYLPSAQLTYGGAGYDNALNPATTGGAGHDSGSPNPAAISNRFFSTTLTGAVWISALVKYSNVGGLPADSQVLLWLRSDASAASYISIRTGAKADLRFNGTDTLSTQTYAENDVHLLLAKLTVNPSGNDSIDFWVDPDLTGGEAGLPTPVLSAGSADAFGTGLTGLGISFYDDGYIDAIRVSNDADGFQQVVGVPEPGSLSLLGASLLACVFARHR